jgi:monovalent cation:H+ antiporter-2, CPA2 family
LYVLFSWQIALPGTAIVMFIVLLIFNTRLNQFYHKIENRFITNLHEKEKSASLDHLSPWDAHLVNYELPVEANIFGKPLQEVGLREKYGVNIAFIQRGNTLMIAPTKDDVLYPYDVVGVIGTDQQLHDFSSVLTKGSETSIHDEKDNIQLEQIAVSDHSSLKGLSIKDSEIREKTFGLVVGIERHGNRILNPPSVLVFEAGDVIWIVGDKRKIRELYRSRR